ncbi:hypothetical protein B0T19DRAFT_462496 [Cercophora scortea]|uniref:2EXR domain-containing protein n=1 Tax=Cercophora scortea TaxID=314031 RepID=A0AAE0M8A2_9PEZI|nr:hypothetical protein B0T19DRAFT_462496 [Cercophora scortea]
MVKTLPKSRPRAASPPPKRRKKNKDPETTVETPAPPTTFPQFSKLPVELQMMVWELVPTPTRIIKGAVLFGSLENHDPSSGARAMNTSLAATEARFLVLPAENAVPPILRTCRLSRVVGLKRFTLLKHYTFSFAATEFRPFRRCCRYTVPQPTGKAVYVDLAHDIFDIRAPPFRFCPGMHCYDNCSHRSYIRYSESVRCPYDGCNKLHIPQTTLRRGIDLSTGWQPPKVVSSASDLRPAKIPFHEVDAKMYKQIKDEFAAKLPSLVEKTISFTRMMGPGRSLTCSSVVTRQWKELMVLKEPGPAGMQRRKQLRIVRLQMEEWMKEETRELHAYEWAEEAAESRAERDAMENI